MNIPDRGKSAACPSALDIDTVDVRVIIASRLIEDVGVRTACGQTV
ncbi:MAG: hypothetical protein SCM11_01165 [Bacillota bacterium]|nr:hypothetical protein [Bacillota bacterium]